MSDNNTAIPKEIMDKIEYFAKQFNSIGTYGSVKQGAEFAYKLRQQEVQELQSALTHEKEMRSKEKDEYNKRINELETELRRLQAFV